MTEINCSTLVEVLRWRANLHPDKTAFTFLRGGTEECSLTFKELDEEASAIASLLQSQTAAGDRALLLYPSGREFIPAFLGCLYAGIIAAPTYPPDPARLDRSAQRLQAILRDAQPSVILTTSELLNLPEAVHRQFLAAYPSRLLSTSDLTGVAGQPWREPEITSDTIALLQYTSGSTASPRGVMVTHGNLVHNERLIQRACEHDDQSTFVTWLPLYHDMGLIGTVLQPLFIGARSVIMSPFDFLRNPMLWLGAITSYRAVTSGGPNFSYDLCVRKIGPEQIESLDLSSWKVAFNGAEPIRHETITRFSEAFRPCGFRPQTFFPCYGLAEATLIVSGTPRAVAPSAFLADSSELELNRVKKADGVNARAIVSSGAPLDEMRVVIACQDTFTTREPGNVGEIWINGPSIALGYWGRREETEQTFGAYLADAGEGPFLRTGDLGFISDGELFITGRLKDLIIIRGRNHYPQDIEHTVERLDSALRAGCGAAFSVEAAGVEQLAIIQEVEDISPADAESLFRTIIKAISEVHNIQVSHIVLVKPHTVPKTSSGKIQRRICRQSFLEGRLKVVAAWQASSPLETAQSYDAESIGEIESWLASSLASKLGLGVHEVKTTDPISSYGVDSLAAIELSHSLETNLGVVLDMSSFLGDSSIADLAVAAFDRRGAMQVASPFITGAEKKESPGHRLSFGQQSLWFMSLLAPQSAAYNVSAAARIGPNTDLQALHRAIGALIARHALLRTTVAMAEGQPVQITHDEVKGFFRVEEIQDVDWPRVERRLTQEASAPFDIERGPLLRATAFRGSAGDILALTFHHFAVDFWSLCVFVEELGKQYQAELTGRPANLPDLKFRYIDYVDWQAERLSGPEGERLSSYWRSQLEGAPVELRLPTDRLRPSVQTYQGASIPFQLTPEQAMSLTALGRRQNATLYMVLLAALNALINRYTGQDDFLIGSMTSGRTRAELRGLIGYFINPIALRARMADAPRFDHFLESVRSTVLGAYAHQEYPFQSVVELLQPHRETSHTPLFQVAFVMQNPPSGYPQALSSFALGIEGAYLMAGPLDLESISIKPTTSQFDLLLTMAEVGGALVGTWQFSADLFDQTTIERMSRHFAAILDAVAADPRQSVASLPLLTVQEWNEVIGQYQASPSDPRRPSLHQFVDVHADQRPNKVALVFGTQYLTYGQLNMRANQLAHYLIRLGVKPESPVGVLMERSAEMVIALIAVLKAGGAYVPLDPAHPKERLTLLLKDANPSVLITGQEMVGRLPDHEATVVDLNSQWSEISRESVCAPNIEQDLSLAAYIIYTSGSTGAPKGVIVTHRNAVRLFEATDSLFGFGDQDVWTMFHSYAFDFSVWEMWGAFIYGGKLVVVPSAISRSPESFHQLLIDENVTALNQTPIAFSQLDRADESSEVKNALHLRLIIFGGEALESRKLTRWIERHGDQRPMLINMYGITETTVHVTHKRITKADLVARPKSVIGAPLTDLGLHILDEQRRPVPLGVIGEIYVAGSGLARGYLNGPDLTAERFIPNPYSGIDGDRLYKSGDLGRYLPDGQVEYLGRNDQQAKIRGHRIELGEIEAVLRQHASLHDAVATILGSDNGEKRLAAYVVASKEIPTSELRDYLKERLPEYMIPASFVRLENLPLTANGKLDRKALPPPDYARPEQRVSYLAPKTEIELKIARIWRDLLNVDKVGLNDNFFDLGANSVLIARVSGQLKNVIGVEVSVVDIFKHPTIKALTEHLNRESSSDLLSKQHDFNVNDRRASMRKRAAERKERAKRPQD